MRLLQKLFLQKILFFAVTIFKVKKLLLWKINERIKSLNLSEKFRKMKI
jgi:hypothetical protein